MDSDDINKKDFDAHGEYTHAYIEILNTYQRQIKKSVKKKNALKKKFFNTIRLILFVLMALFVLTAIGSLVVFGMMIYYKQESVAIITGAVTTIISSFSTMVISIFKLPEIIADYLFNKEEDSLMNEIIKNIQTYEIGIVKVERSAIIEAEKNKTKMQKNDQRFANSPNTKGRTPENASEEYDKTT